MPLDPGRHWLAAGITGLPRQREWDAVVTVEAPGTPGDELELVVLPDGRVLVEGEGSDPGSAVFAEALRGAIDAPYRAVAVRRPELWVVGAREIEVVRLHPDPGGDELELTWDRATLSLTIDGVPEGAARASALEQVAAGREAGSYAAHAHRLEGDLWELLLLPL